jgi:hypothetical protein
VERQVTTGAIPVADHAFHALRRGVLVTIWRGLAASGELGGTNPEEFRERCVEWLDGHDIRNRSNIEFVMRMTSLTEGAFLDQPSVLRLMQIVPTARDQALVVLQRTLLYRGG